MGLTSLQIGMSGVNASRRALEVIAQNVANVNTEGYSRRRVEQTVNSRLTPMSWEIPRELEAGVRVTGVIRVRDALLDSSFRTQASQVAAAQLRADVAARAESVLGPLDSGALDALDNFWASWERLASRPQDLAARQEVLSAGERVASAMRSASQQIFRIEELIAARGTDIVGKLNTYATQLAQLNQQIADATFRGAAPNDLLDERDKLLDRIARLTTITVVEGTYQQANVYIGSYPLVDGALAKEIVQPPAGGPVWGVGGFPVDLSGELAVVHETLNLTLPQIRDALDEIALSLRDLVNGQHGLGVDLEGDPGSDFFVGSSAADLQVRPGLEARHVAAGLAAAPADNRNALVMATLGRSQLPGGDTVDGLLTGLAGRLGANAAATDQIASMLSAALAAVEDERSSITGVHLDEELSDLIRYQRAYEAAARVLTTADEMLDVLINRTGLVGR